MDLPCRCGKPDWNVVVQKENFIIKKCLRCGGKQKVLVTSDIRQREG